MKPESSLSGPAPRRTPESRDRGGWCGGSQPDQGWRERLSRSQEWCDTLPPVADDSADPVSLLAHVLGLRHRPRW